MAFVISSAASPFSRSFRARAGAALVVPVSPIEWDNVVLYGQYVLNRRLVRVREARDGNP